MQQLKGGHKDEWQSQVKTLRVLWSICITFLQRYKLWPRAVQSRQASAGRWQHAALKEDRALRCDGHFSISTVIGLYGSLYMKKCGRLHTHRKGWETGETRVRSVGLAAVLCLCFPNCNRGAVWEAFALPTFCNLVSAQLCQKTLCLHTHTHTREHSSFIHNSKKTIAETAQVPISRETEELWCIHVEYSGIKRNKEKWCSNINEFHSHLSFIQETLSSSGR